MRTVDPAGSKTALAAIEDRLRRRLSRARAQGSGDALTALIAALLAPATSELPADPEALAAWVAIGDAAQSDTELGLAYGDALARLHTELANAVAVRASPRVLPPEEVAALAGAALAQIEGAWRIGRLAPWVMPSGVAARTLQAMLVGVLGAASESGSLSVGGAQTVPVGAPVGAPPLAPARPQPLGIRLRAKERRWSEELVSRSPMVLSDSVWSAVLAAYTTPDRHYHTLEHLVELSRSWCEVSAGPGWDDPRASWLALLFHDSVQQRIGPRGDDEDRSAALLAALLPDTAAAEALIRLTASHGSALASGLPRDAAHFLDCDLAILAAAPSRFARYETQTAAEYAPLYGVEAYRVGRLAFLQTMSAQPRIFTSDWFHSRLNARARTNLSRSVV